MKRIQFLMGFLCGALLFGGITSGAAAASGIMARVSAQTFYVNGRQVQFEAYAIQGNNYVKLRDIGKAVDFGVTYNGTTNSVYIDPNAHYQEEVKQPASTTPPSSGLTEKGVQATLWGLLDKYPIGTYYGTYYRSTSNGPYGMAPSNCAGWATLCSDAAFGNLPWQRTENPRWEDIRPGDLIEYDNAYGGHVIVVLDKTAAYVLTTESGTNNKARWGGQYFKWWLEEQTGYASYTRYPK